MCFQSLFRHNSTIPSSGWLVNSKLLTQRCFCSILCGRAYKFQMTEINIQIYHQFLNIQPQCSAKFSFHERPFSALFLREAFRFWSAGWVHADSDGGKCQSSEQQGAQPPSEHRYSRCDCCERERGSTFQRGPHKDCCPWVCGSWDSTDKQHRFWPW